MSCRFPQGVKSFSIAMENVGRNRDGIERLRNLLGDGIHGYISSLNALSACFLAFCVLESQEFANLAVHSVFEFGSSERFLLIPRMTQHQRALLLSVPGWHRGCNLLAQVLGIKSGIVNAVYRSSSLKVVASNRRQ